MKKTSNDQKSQEENNDGSLVNQTIRQDVGSGVKLEDSKSSMSTSEALAKNTIKNHVIAAMTIGLVPVPLFDWGLLIGNQVKMVHGLSKLYGVPFEENRVRSIIISLFAGSLPVFGTIGLSMGAKLIPGIGTLLGSGIVSTTGGATTYAVGNVFLKHFESGGTLMKFDIKKMRNIFKKEINEGHEVAKEFDAEAELAANAKAS